LGESELRAFLHSRKQTGIYIEQITAGIEDCFMYLLQQTPLL